jgi:hypothetical protein
MDRNNSSNVLKTALQTNWSHLMRNNNGEVFFSMRKTIASQLGVLGALSYLLQSSAPNARETIMSAQNGRVVGYNMKPVAAALALTGASSSGDGNGSHGGNDDGMDVDTTSTADDSTKKSKKKTQTSKVINAVSKKATTTKATSNTKGSANTKANATAKKASDKDKDDDGDDDEVVFLRLTPAVLTALSLRVVNSTLRTAMGNTAAAVNKQQSLAEVSSM